MRLTPTAIVQQFKFVWAAPRSGPIGSKVILHTSFDDWKPTPMERNPAGVWEVDRMVCGKEVAARRVGAWH